MNILISTKENGFTIKGYDPKFSQAFYVAETERSLLDIISNLWRDYKNDTARRKHNENPE